MNAVSRMEKAWILVGEEYALRERRMAGAPLQCVRILQHIRRNKWKAQWVRPNPGLVDYVESAQLLVVWKDHKSFLRDEKNAEQLAGQNERDGYVPGSPVEVAVEQVFESVGSRSAAIGEYCPGRLTR